MKLYRTLIQVEILSDGPVLETNLNSIAREIEMGDWSGDVAVIAQEEVTPDQMADLLIAQGSDPSFLLGDSDEASAEIFKQALERDERLGHNIPIDECPDCGSLLSWVKEPTLHQTCRTCGVDVE